ncbi:class I SAM-dependent methyltransferase [Isoalcanivorax beigongshangi]|uniref:Class I SAM-dependent methyltransferase n=1 Tax=Isoalcanivorax beigongshangi TaxID=3238810 RepID=A0ABV4AFB3_9GAMM
MNLDYGPLSTLFYDASKPVGYSLNGDLAFYLKQAAQCGGRLLEPAVGTGRMLIPLLEAGFEVDGLDRSADMLARCREHCQARGLSAQLLQADMAAFALPLRYAGILLPAGSFCLITELEQARAALACFHHHLLPGGRLVLDIEPPPSTPWQPSSTRLTLANGRTLTLDCSVANFEPEQQRYELALHYRLMEGEQVVAEEQQPFPLRWYHAEQMQRLLETSGFEVESVLSDYRVSGVQSGAEMLTFIARRKK